METYEPLFINGVIQSPFDIRDYKIVASKELPEEFQTSKVAVKNQGSQSTCVPHALSTVIEYHNKRQQNNSKKFSTEFIYGCRSENDYKGEGMIIREALKTIQKYGDPYYTDLKGNNSYSSAMKNVAERFDTLEELAYPHRISSYVRLNSVEEMKSAIMKYGPIVVSMKWFSKYKITDGVYSYSGTKYDGYHCVMVYGWNSTGWLVQNSWGTLWGDKGRFIVPYSYEFREAWGIIDEIVDNKDIIKPKNNVFNKVINFIVNLFKKIFCRS